MAARAFEDYLLPAEAGRDTGIEGETDPGHYIASRTAALRERLTTSPTAPRAENSTVSRSRTANRAIADALGVHHDTIDRDAGGKSRLVLRLMVEVPWTLPGLQGCGFHHSRSMRTADERGDFLPRKVGENQWLVTYGTT